MADIVSARVELNEYTNKVLNIIKIKFNLKDKSEAINKFIDIYGEDIVEKEVSDEYMQKVIQICDDHFAKHGLKKMTLEELHKLTGVKK